MKEEFLSRKQLNLLPKRLKLAEETDATKELYKYIELLRVAKNYKPLRILVTGTGGSYPAALFARDAFHAQIYTPYVDALTPQAALRTLTQFDYVNGPFNAEYDLVIGISYSGTTKDIEAVYEICKNKHIKFLLLTGTSKDDLSSLYKEDDLLKIISYSNPNDAIGKEESMISFFPTLAPAIILDDNYTAKLIKENQEALTRGLDFVTKLPLIGIAAVLKKRPTVHIFYEWDTMPTAFDLESKFIESGIANVILHEKKNFSHGRNSVLHRLPFGLIINLTRYYWKCDAYKTAYDKKLTEYLKEVSANQAAHYIELGTPAFMACQWNIEAMCKAPYLVTAIGEKMDIDISKPFKPFPKEAIDLYNYKGLF